MFIYGCIVLLGISAAILKRFGIPNPYSKGVGLTIAFSLLAAISLGQNYTQSLS
ncbi:hypothetical protein [Bacillus sp. SG-1]|uniref:hypothetical protein n=1 Tax=Bacillus sp. SG-1 TaxID=161544 RepID=UPI00031058F3|nr:hypothetical protein [Bacillus sp. SG-1]